MIFSGPACGTVETVPLRRTPPDGRRFLMRKTLVQEQAPTQINVVLNWFEELKRRVPAGR